MRLPTAVTRSIQALVALMVLSAMTTALMALMRNRLILSWATSRPGRLDDYRDGAVRPPAFVPVAIVLFVVVAALIAVLLVYLRNGEGWARLCLSALVVFTAVATIGALVTTPPAEFVVLAYASLVIEAVALGCLWHPTTSAYLAGRWVPQPDPAARA